MARSHALLRLAVRPVCPRQHFVARRAASSKPGLWRVLGIETSADDTCLALMEFRMDKQQREMGKASKINRITYDNKKHGGIHPVEAVESHTKNLARMVSQYTGPNKSKPDLICVTRGPGMGGCLSVGVTTAKALSALWKVPIVGVHHMQAHALTCAMEHTIGSAHYGGDIAYPFLTLLVSGKHTMLVHSKSPVNHRILAQSDTVALGDALDKIARELVPSSVIESQPDDQPICYPLLLEQMTVQLSDFYEAAKTRKDEIKTYQSGFGWMLQPPLQQSREMKYNFNALASRTLTALRANPEMAEAERQVLGTQFMRLAFEHLVSRVILALETDEDLLRDPPKHLILSGGVASNMFLRTIIHETLKARGHKSVKLCVPSPEYCTDNAAMIAYAGWKMYLDGWTTDLDFCPIVKWSIEEILTGADCWTRRDGFPPLTPEDAQREFAGPSLVTNDDIPAAQDPLSSDTKQEDGFPGESLFFPSGSHMIREMTDSRERAELPEEELETSNPSPKRSEDAVHDRKIEASEEDVKQAELPPDTKEETARNDLAGTPEKEPTRAGTASNTSKDVVPSNPLEAPSKDNKAPNLSSHPSEKTTNVKSPDSPGEGLDQFNLKLDLLIDQAVSLLDTITLDSRSRNDSAAKKSQVASKAVKRRTPTAHSTASAEKSSKNGITAKKQPQKQQQPATEKKKAGTKMSTPPKPVSSRRSPLKPLATSKVAAKQPPIVLMPGRHKKNLRELADEVQEWLPNPAPEERHALKVRHLGFADEQSPPRSRSAPTFMGRMARMFGLGSKR